jgi:hypothetical protein
MSAEAPTSCAACGVTFTKDAASHVGVYVTSSGGMWPHRLCDRCMNRALASDSGRAEIAERVELRFSSPGGEA